MFENDIELQPAIKLYDVEILRYDFNENFCNERYFGNDIDTMYGIWKHELLTFITNLA